MKLRVHLEGRDVDLAPISASVEIDDPTLETAVAPTLAAELLSACNEVLWGDEDDDDEVLNAEQPPPVLPGGAAA